MYTCCVRSMNQSESTLAERRIKCPHESSALRRQLEGVPYRPGTLEGAARSVARGGCGSLAGGRRRARRGWPRGLSGWGSLGLARPRGVLPSRVPAPRASRGSPALARARLLAALVLPRVPRAVVRGLSRRRARGLAAWLLVHPRFRFFATLMHSTTQPPLSAPTRQCSKNAGARDLHRLF